GGGGKPARRGGSHEEREGKKPREPTKRAREGHSPRSQAPSVPPRSRGILMEAGSSACVSVRQLRPPPAPPPVDACEGPIRQGRLHARSRSRSLFQKRVGG